MPAWTLTAWSPCQLGEVTLQHRIVLAPLTRGRASQSTQDCRTWVPNDIMQEYYSERATPGGLLISEAGPVSLRASGRHGIPGWFTAEQQAGWRRIAESVHAKGGVIFAQLWHQGRTTHSAVAGTIPESSSASRLDGEISWSGFAPRPLETPKEMTLEDIRATQDDFVNAAIMARGAGFDGIEIHAGNGYLFDQFHHSNINHRTDSYGGSIEARCRFTLETVDKLCHAIGSGRCAVRLSPFGFFNGTDGEDRMQQWLHLCTELSKRQLAYVHLIEPRFDEFKSQSEKAALLGDMSFQDVSLGPFQEALGSTPLLSAGGFGPDNYEDSIRAGTSDLVAFGRYFIANPDLVDRLRQGLPLYKWDRSTFYGPFEQNELGYTVHRTRELASASDSLKGQMQA